jgi:pimeloyl-ACP methyl ester carboxylesterase
MTTYRERRVPFQTQDGFSLDLINVRAEKEPTKGPIILVHGAGVRANIFRAPVKTTVVDALVAEGYDVWLENWRASIDFAPNEWTLDQASRYDHPAAVNTVLRETGASQMKALVHCQGSTSFTMSAVAGLVPSVTTIVSNAVSLHPVVPGWSRFKLDVLVPITRLLTRYLSPSWGLSAPTPVAKAILGLARLFHHECDNDVCKLVSFVYGAGFPALWRHENLSAETHEWLKREFSYVPLRFHAQMARCVAKGNLVAAEALDDLPRDFAAEPPRTRARFAFIAGEQNRCFLPESQERSYRYFNRLKPSFHSLHVFPSYGHLDIFMGNDAARDVFPVILEELGRSTP